MAYNASRMQKDDSFYEVRPLTKSERASMERANAELHEEIDGLLKDRKPKFSFRARRLIGALFST